MPHRWNAVNMLSNNYHSLLLPQLLWPLFTSIVNWRTKVFSPNLLTFSLKDINMDKPTILNEFVLQVRLKLPRIHVHCTKDCWFNSFLHIQLDHGRGRLRKNSSSSFHCPHKLGDLFDNRVNWIRWYDIKLCETTGYVGQMVKI